MGLASGPDWGWSSTYKLWPGALPYRPIAGNAGGVQAVVMSKTKLDERLRTSTKAKPDPEKIG